MPDERQWFYFVYASLGVYFSGLFFAIIYSAIKGRAGSDYYLIIIYSAIKGRAGSD